VHDYPNRRAVAVLAALRWPIALAVALAVAVGVAVAVAQDQPAAVEVELNGYKVTAQPDAATIAEGATLTVAVTVEALDGTGDLRGAMHLESRLHRLTPRRGNPTTTKHGVMTIAADRRSATATIEVRASGGGRYSLDVIPAATQPGGARVMFGVRDATATGSVTYVHPDQITHQVWHYDRAKVTYHLVGGGKFTRPMTEMELLHGDEGRDAAGSSHHAAGYHHGGTAP